MQALVQWGILLLLVIIVWAVVTSGSRRQRQSVARFQDDLAVGEKVMTASGIFGSIAHLDDSRVGLEVASGVVIEVARQAVVRKVEDAEPAGEAHEPGGEGHDADEDRA